MIKPLRFAAIIGIVSLTCWLSASTQAQPASDCDSLNGTHCDTPDQYTPCYWILAQEHLVCQCDGASRTWVCFY